MRVAIVLFLSIILFFSCGKSAKKNCDGPELECSGVRCITYGKYFDFNLADKITGADLVFGSNPRYASSDIKLYADQARTVSINLNFDTNNKIIHVIDAKEEMYLVIKNTDVYKLTAAFRTETCCSGRVKNLSMNGQSICSCCPDGVTISVQ